MKKFWKSYRLTIPAFAVVLGVILHLVVPGILALVVGVLFSILKMGDPIFGHAQTKEAWAEIWGGVGLFLYIQVGHAVISTSVFGIAAALLIHRVSPKSLYLVAILFALGLHYAFTAIFAASYYVIVSREVNFNILIYNSVIVTMVAPLLGLIAAFLRSKADRVADTV